MLERVVRAQSRPSGAGGCGQCCARNTGCRPRSDRHGERRLQLSRLSSSAVYCIPFHFVTGLTDAFGVAAVATGFAFVVIGDLKSRWSVRPWLRSAP